MIADLKYTPKCHNLYVQTYPFDTDARPHNTLFTRHAHVVSVIRGHRHAIIY